MVDAQRRVQARKSPPAESAGLSCHLGNHTVCARDRSAQRRFPAAATAAVTMKAARAQPLSFERLPLREQGNCAATTNAPGGVMDSDRFDAVTRLFAPLLTRRGLAGLLGMAALGRIDLAEAKKRKRKKKRKNKKGKGGNQPPEVKLNQFGCVNVGDFCESASQCCSGTCEGSACKAHDTGICQAGQNVIFCADGATNISCTGPGGALGLCLTTTGNAGLCATDRQCVSCKKDADCQSASVCGPGAACVVCANCLDTGGTACVASGASGCS